MVPRHTPEIWYTPKNFKDAFATIRKKYASAATQATGGIVKKNRKNEFSLNVIQFVPEKMQGSFNIGMTARYRNTGFWSIASMATTARSRARRESKVPLAIDGCEVTSEPDNS